MSVALSMTGANVFQREVRQSNIVPIRDKIKAIPKREEWNPDYVKAYQNKVTMLRGMLNDPIMAKGAMAFYAEHPEDFIEHWCVTYDPRNAGTTLPTLMPFILFKRQRELIQFIVECIRDQECGLIEKCRDMGATWLCAAVSVWLWLFTKGAAIGWGSRKESLVDKLGDPDSIFEKMRIIINNLPPVFLPESFKKKEHCTYMKILNPEPDSMSTIIGEAGNNIGRGGRSSIYFKDEAAYYEQPEAIEAALGDNTNVQIDISSVAGPGTVFSRKRDSGVVWYPGKKIPPGIIRVFVMDWRDHPKKTEEWYNLRKEKARREGLLHVFAREVDRDTSASVLGTAIPREWVMSAVGAHKKLNVVPSGTKRAALDVADEGRDSHALAIRKGVLLTDVEEWPQGDGGDAARQSMMICQTKGIMAFDYDCIGVGAAVKSEINRLIKEREKPYSFAINKWSASDSPLHPKKHLLKNPDGTPDRNSPTNEDFFANLKAQGWWMLRTRFEKTHKAVTEGVEYPEEELIFIDEKLLCLHQVIKELTQPTIGYDKKGKMLINKKGDGEISPNKGDAIMMVYWPIPSKILNFTAISASKESVWDK